MGLYDEIIFTCPNCGGRIIEQSKAGDGTLKTFSCDEVLLNIANDIIGEEAYCNSCNESFEISQLYEKIPKTIPLCLKSRY